MKDKMRLSKCSMCRKTLKTIKDRHFEGMLGPLPIALHKKCFIKLNANDELTLKDKT